MKNKILVIDDEQSICFLLDNFLKNTYDVIIKRDGLEALEWLVGNLPDLIICDIQMPNIDGYQFLEKVRHLDYTKQTPVIMLSGTESSPDRVRCYRLGAQDFLAKPFNPEELEELIKKNLNPIHYPIKC
jgi:DNA-binding response OmpR family regulator